MESLFSFVSRFFSDLSVFPSGESSFFRIEYFVNANDTKVQAWFYISFASTPFTLLVHNRPGFKPKSGWIAIWISTNKPCIQLKLRGLQKNRIKTGHSKKPWFPCIETGVSSDFVAKLYYKIAAHVAIDFFQTGADGFQIPLNGSGKAQPKVDFAGRRKLNEGVKPHSPPIQCRNGESVENIFFVQVLAVVIIVGIENAETVADAEFPCIYVDILRNGDSAGLGRTLLLLPETALYPGSERKPFGRFHIGLNHPVPAACRYGDIRWRLVVGQISQLVFISVLNKKRGCPWGGKG